MCYFVLVLFSPLSIEIDSLGEENANLSAFRTLVRFALVWFSLFPFPLGIWEGLRFVIVALPGLTFLLSIFFFFFFFFFLYKYSDKTSAHVCLVASFDVSKIYIGLMFSLKS